MAGFFRQLAEQALQPANALRPLALATPFEPPGDGLPSDADAAMPISDPPQAGWESGHVARVGAVAPAVGGRAPEAQVPMAETRRESPRAATPAQDLRPPSATTGDAPRRPRRTVRSDRPAAHEDARIPGHDEHARNDAHEATRSPEAPPHLPRAQPRVAALRPLPPPARAASAQARAEIATHTAAAVTPDVHIHIGRIELTAAVPPPATKRPAAAGRKPLSLDDYLRQRGGKTP